MAAIKTMKEWGTTVVMVTHNMRLLGPVDKIMVLNEGRIQAIGDRAEVLAAMRPKSVRISNPEPMRLPKDDSEPGSATITELGA